MRTALLLIASLFICAWGNTESLIFLLISIGFNWVFGMLLDKHPNCLPLAVLWDIIYLCLFKYLGMGSAIPIGISYYTLSAISYCTDVARGDGPAQYNPAKLAVYIAFFPKLIMGPTALYKDFYDQIDMPSVNSDMAADGMLKFTIGLAKKMIIAGNLADMTLYCWNDAPYSVASAWLGIIGFSLQLYYDFSGYSDMAIGLSKMLGFEIKENFLYPYESSSLSQFWSRWHIALGSWFKNYIYFPLGGNRKGLDRTLVNIFIVWLATGLWHGNGWNYILWSMLLFVFVYLEKVDGLWTKLPRPLAILCTDLIVMGGWVMFNSATPIDAISYYGYLIGEATDLSSGISNIYYYENLPLILIATVGCTSFPKTCAKQIFSDDSMVTTIAKCVFILALLAASTVFIVLNGYTPFIYQSF